MNKELIKQAFVRGYEQAALDFQKRAASSKNVKTVLELAQKVSKKPSWKQRLASMFWKPKSSDPASIFGRLTAAGSADELFGQLGRNKGVGRVSDVLAALAGFRNDPAAVETVSKVMRRAGVVDAGGRLSKLDSLSSLERRRLRRYLSNFGFAQMPEVSRTMSEATPRLEKAVSLYNQLSPADRAGVVGGQLLKLMDGGSKSVREIAEDGLRQLSGARAAAGKNVIKSKLNSSNASTRRAAQDVVRNLSPF